MDDNAARQSDNTGNPNRARGTVNLSQLTESDVAAIRDDLVRAVVERAKYVEIDAHSSHGNVHSSAPDR